MNDELGINPNWESASLTQLPPLRPGELHLWWLPLELPQSQQRLALHLLSDIQRDKYERRRTAALKRAYLASRYYLLNLLGGYTQTKAEDVLLSYSRLNKPYLSDKSADLHFNFTDTANKKRHYGVFAFARSLEVGIDIEARSRNRDFAKIAARRFTPNELAYVTDNGIIDAQKFLAIWTRKEAFGKATGTGINFQMNQQNLFESKHPEMSFYDSHQQAWRLMQFELGTEFIACVVHRSHQKLVVRSFHTLEIS